MSFWADEDIMRSYISDFEVGRVECFCCHDDGINEIPEFWFIEEFLFDIAAIDDFITEKIGVVFVCDIGDSSTAAELSFGEVVLDGEEDVLALADLSY